jgi:WD40 repeat protein
MTIRRLFVVVCCLILLPLAVRAQAPGAPEPLLRLEADGPTAYVTSLAFDPRDGKTLYAAGFDKVVRAWALDEKGQFVIDRAAAFRVPIGPELQGAINSMVISPDGEWLAAAGSAVVRKSAGFGTAGMILPGRPPDDEMLLDEGRIFVFNAKRELTVLRGNKGVIQSLAFAPPIARKPPILVSTALERDKKDPDKREGVIRVWNLATGNVIDEGGGQPTRRILPGIAVWHTGPKLKELRVAYAWGDGKLRVWDVDRGLFERPDGLDDRAWKPTDQLNQNNTIAKLPGEEKFITGSYDGRKGQLRMWTAPAGAAPKVEERPLLEVVKGNKGRFLPLALSVLPYKNDLYAAVVLRKDPPLNDPAEKQESYVLRVIGVTGRNTGVEVADVLLWQGAKSLPSVATSPTGEYVAVAGNREHTIKVFRIADLLAGRKPQVLHGIGKELPSAGFLRRGNGQLGILLRQHAVEGPANREPDPNPEEDLVFDISARALLTYGEQFTHTRNAKILAPRPDAWSMLLAATALSQLDWKPDAPKLGGWRVAWNDQQTRQALVITEGDKEITRLSLAEGQRVTAFALRPPLDPLKDPVLAVAFTERGLPRLRLYNGRTGEWFRQCSGHTDPIHSLAISSDGRLLVSAGDDQTVCVWSLTNLDKIIGVHGQLTGVAVKGGAGDPVEIVKIDADSPAKEQLKEKEVIESLTVDKKETKVTTARDYYDALFMMKPGATVTVQLKGKPAVNLKVGQGIDERKPLFSLFVTRDAKRQQWEWVGWNPSGYYESSGPAVEEYIGFQVNNADTPEKASTFAPAPEYRKKLYKEGILRHLVIRGNLSAALKDWNDEDMAKPRPQPKMTLFLDELGPDPANVDEHGQLVVLKAPVTLVVHLDDLDANRIDWVRYQIDGEAGGLKPLDARNSSFGPSENEWSADLKRIADKAGVYRVRVRVRTREAPPREWEESLLVRYQAPAPVIKVDPDLPAVVLTKPADGLIVYEEGQDAPMLEVEAQLAPPVGAAGCEAIVLVNDQAVGKPISVSAKAETVAARFPLVPGPNRVQLQLRTEKTVGRPSEALQVSYLRPPRFVKFEDAEKWKTPSERALVALAARIHSAMELKKENSRATVNGHDIADVEIEKVDAQTWRVRLPSVSLVEGSNEVRLWAANADGPSRTPGELRVVYKAPPKPPAPPSVEILFPARDVIITDPEIELRARITSSAPVKVALTRRGKGPAELPAIKAEETAKGVYELRQFIKQLAPGENNLLLIAQNDGGSDEAPVVVTYLKKPVRMQIDYLQPKGQDVEIKPDRQLNGKLLFKEVPQALCVVHGVVSWDEKDEDLVKAVNRVRGYVNGKRQPMTLLFKAKAGDRKRTFELTLQFTQPKDNVVEIELPDLAQEASNPMEFLVDCKQPNAKQFGHLLVIGAGKTEKAQLIQRALHSIQGKITEGTEFKADAFSGGRIYGPLTGSTVTPDRVLTQLLVIKSQIEKRAREGAANDIVLVYYEGNEAVTSDGHFLRTNRSRYDSDLKTSALTMDSLEAFCGEIMGAQVLLLDVARDNSIRAAASDADKDEVIKRPRNSHVSVFRSLSWLDHPDAPSDPLLLVKWEEATKARAKLGEVGDEVGEMIKPIKPLTYDKAIPKSARDLLVGKSNPR